MGYSDRSARQPSGSGAVDGTPRPGDFQQRVEVERSRRSAGESTGSRRAVTSTGGYRIRTETTGTQRRADDTGNRRGEDTGSRRAVTGTGSHRVQSETKETARLTAQDTGGQSATTATGGYRTITDATGIQHRVAESSEQRSRVSDGQTATGYHRVEGKAAGRRRIARWPIVVGGFVLLLVVGLLGWGWANNVLDSRAEAQANGCAEGNATMKVLVAPSVQKPVAAAAASWNQANTVVHAHCIHVDVAAMASDQALSAFTGRTSLDSIGGLPAAWIADNGSQINQLQQAKPAMIAAPPESVAYTSSADYQFVGLTGTNLDEVQARAAQVFRDYLLEPTQKADFTAAGLTPR